MNRSKKGGLGRALTNNMNRSNKGKKHVANNSMLHTSEINDGYDWGRLNLNSITEESSLEKFLSTAELAATEFQAEKLDVNFVRPNLLVGLLTDKEMDDVKALQEQYKSHLRIPRRPQWNPTTTPEQLDQMERESFLEWRRNLAELEEQKGLSITPFEKNLEFWRQLWRVVERSDVIVQIVDARNPLLFWCQDLADYVKEVSSDKENLILLNKADYLTDEQRQHWADYFTSKGIKAVFFSAILASEETNLPDITEVPEEDSCIASENVTIEVVEERINNLNLVTENISNKFNELNRQISEFIEENGLQDKMSNSVKILSRQELIDLLHNVYPVDKLDGKSVTIGLVGYPNVGKSSTINALLLEKKVSVSATPGKTKHFQTLYLDKDVILCDCPGLVMPSFTFTKAEMILNGILPIDHLKDHVPPINLITTLIPRHILEKTYSILLPPPLEIEDPDRRPFAQELLNAYGYNRGFMTAKNQPDNAKAARYILKDFVNGKLLYCYAPPGVEQEVYHMWPPKPETSKQRNFTPQEYRAVTVNTNKFTDKNFNDVGSHVQPVNSNQKLKAAYLKQIENASQQQSEVLKPWRFKEKKRKEKLRRVYAHLDQH